MNKEQILNMDRNTFNNLMCESTRKEIVAFAKLFGHYIHYINNKNKVQLAQEFYLIWDNAKMEMEATKSKNKKHNSINVINKAGETFEFSSIKDFHTHLETEFCMTINKGHLYNLVNGKSKSYKGYMLNN